MMQPSRLNGACLEPGDYVRRSRADSRLLRQKNAVQYHELLAQRVGMGTEETPLRVTHDGRSQRHFITHALEHAALDTGLG